MIKTNFVIGLLALAFFNAQYRGWNLFDSAASAQASRLSGNGAHVPQIGRPQEPISTGFFAVRGLKSAY